MSTLSSKDPEEIITVAFDMSALTTTPSNPVVSIDVRSGTTDPDVDAMLVGTPVVSGALVKQQVQGGINGTTYGIKCQVDAPDRSRYIEVARLPVRSV